MLVKIIIIDYAGEEELELFGSSNAVPDTLIFELLDKRGMRHGYAAQ